MQTVSRKIAIKPVKKGTGIGETMPGAKVYLTANKKRGRYLFGHTPEQIDSYKEITVDNDYVKNFKMRLGDKIAYLYPDTYEEDLFAYRLAQSHSMIANNEGEVTHLTKFVMIDEEKEAAGNAKKLELITDAYVWIKEHNPLEKRQFLSLFGISTKGLSDDLITTKLREQAEKNPESFLARENDPRKDAKILVNELIDYGVLRTDGPAIYYNEVLLGVDMTLAVEYLNEDRNQDVKIKLIALLKEKRNI